jgi:hypothetical protein
MLAAAMVVVAEGAAAQGLLSGTAFSVAPELLVTNQHVVSGCLSVDAIFSDGRRKSSIVAVDADNDLALLRVPGLKGTTATLRSPSTLRLGESVFVFGFPLTGALSSGGNFTSGLVSALRGLRDSASQVQITSPIQPGNSGGPLMDSSGLVIGVVQAKLDAIRAAKSIGDVPQNVNFAISLASLTQFLIKHKIDFRTATRSAALDAASVAEMAQNFTHRVECRGRDQKISNPTAPNVNETARAVLYEEDRADPNGKLFVGSASWRTEAADGAELAVRAEIKVPQRNLDVVMLFRHNLDRNSPASHTIEIRFNSPPDGVANVPGMLVKETQQTRGTPLAGLAAKVTNGSFLVGLSAVEADQDRNMQLLRERAWLDIPIVYNDKRRAILAVGKGADGIRAFEQAFASWQR